MSLIDSFFLIKKKVFEKRNIILMLALFFIFFAIMLCLVIFHFCLSYIYDTLKFDVSYRTVIVEENSSASISDLKTIPHVVFLDNIKFERNFTAVIDSLNKENLSSQVMIYSLLDNNEVQIYKGHLPEKSGEMICSDTFYPYDPYEAAGNLTSIFAVKLKEENYLKSSTLIGKSFTFTTNPYIADTNIHFPFSETVVGTYKHKYNLNHLNSCYINVQDFDKYVKNIEHSYLTSNGQYHTEIDGRLLLRVDSYKNVDFVLNQLKELGYKAEVSQNMDTATKQIILSIPCGIIIIILFISFELIYHFLKKRIQSRTKN